MQIAERVSRHPASPDLHARARDWIEHPGCNHGDDTWLRLDLHETAGDTLLAAAEANPLPTERVPAIMDDDFLPDMGRMTGRLPSEGGTGRSPAPTQVGGGRRRSTL